MVLTVAAISILLVLIVVHVFGRAYKKMLFNLTLYKRTSSFLATPPPKPREVLTEAVYRDFKKVRLKKLLYYDACGVVGTLLVELLIRSTFVTEYNLFWRTCISWLVFYLLSGVIYLFWWHIPYERMRGRL